MTGSLQSPPRTRLQRSGWTEQGCPRVSLQRQLSALVSLQVPGVTSLHPEADGSPGIPSMSFSPGPGSTASVISPGDARVTQVTDEHHDRAFHNRGPVCPGGMDQQQAKVLAAPRCLQATIDLSHVACCHFMI